MTHIRLTMPESTVTLSDSNGAPLQRQIAGLAVPYEVEAEVWPIGRLVFAGRLGRARTARADAPGSRHQPPGRHPGRAHRAACRYLRTLQYRPDRGWQCGAGASSERQPSRPLGGCRHHQF